MQNAVCKFRFPPSASLRQSQFLYTALERFAIAYGAILYARPVVVDGIDRIMQKLGYLAAVFDA
jgi:hypothetical protein